MKKRDEVLEIVGHMRVEADNRDRNGLIDLVLAQTSLAAEHMSATKRRIWLKQLRGEEDGVEKKNGGAEG